MSSPDEETLRKMPYSELKKHAQKHGIRKSMKAEKIIASILCKKEANEDSFVTLERQIINSCKKNKELLFEEDKKVVSDTPRRETYTVDDPVTDIETIRKSIVATSASPELKKANISVPNQKIAPESAKKNRKSKRKVSFVTPLRRSARFFTVTPQYNSLKDRPKTPIPNRLSSAKRMSIRGNKNLADSLNLDSSVEDGKISGGNVKRPSTPMPISKQKRKRLSSLGHSDDALSPNLKPVAEIAPVLQELVEETSDETPSKSFYATPNASSDVKQEKSNFSTINEIIKSTTPLPSSTLKLKSAQKTKATPRKSFTPKKVGITTPGLKRATPLHSNKALVSQTSGLKPTKTPLSKSKNALTRSAVKFGMSSSAAQKASTPRSAVKFGMSSSAAQKASTPIPGLKLTSTPGITLSTAKKIATPNFSKIHQVAFDKMESIDDYQKRKALNSAKKLKEQRKYHAPNKSNINKKAIVEKIEKIPKTFSGIPFVPAKKQTVKRNIQKSSGLKPKITITKPASLNASSLSQKLIKASNAKAIKSAAKENTPLKQRQKFDLRASLAKKLTYRPHTGPIKPLSESKHNGNISTILPSAKNLQTENKVVNNSRMETRDVLRGVRKNKRFLLQMNNRNQSMQK